MSWFSRVEEKFLCVHDVSPTSLRKIFKDGIINLTIFVENNQLHNYNYSIQ